MEDDPFYIGVVESSDAQAEGPRSTSEIPVDELVPATILKELQLQPHLSAAVFGYDIQQMSERPWTKPGANLRDYFNYGFNEKTWRIFCAMQAEGKDALVEKAESFYERIEGITNAQRDAASSMYPSFGGGPTGQIPVFPPGAPSSQYDRQGRGETGSFFKTKMCQRFQEGRCTRGSACNFAHGAHELRSGPQFQPRDAPPQQPPTRMPYPAPPGSGSADNYYAAGGVLGMPPIGSGYPSMPMGNPPMPMSGYPQGNMVPEGSYQSVPNPPHTGFRMAPAKRDRDDEGRVFEQGLQ
jgi:hypothetical protein